LDDAGEPHRLLVRVLDFANDLRRRMRAVAELDERVGERLIRVHRHMARDVVKDVRLGKVIELVRSQNRDRRGKLSVAQAIKEHKRGNVTAHRLRLETRQWAQKLVDFVKAWNAVGIETESIDTPKKPLVRVLLPSRLHPRIEAAPRLVILFRIQLIGLIDV